MSTNMIVPTLARKGEQGLRSPI